MTPKNWNNLFSLSFNLFNDTELQRIIFSARFRKKIVSTYKYTGNINLKITFQIIK